MIEFFDGTCINNSPAKLNQEKLLWLNQHYLMQMEIEQIVPLFEEQLKILKLKPKYKCDLTTLVSLQRERAKTLREMVEMSDYFLDDIKKYDEKACKKHLNEETLNALKLVREQLSRLANWEKEKIHQIIIEVSKKTNLKMGKVAQPIRIAASGGSVSPPIDITLVLLGKKLTLKRIDDLFSYFAGTGHTEGEKP